MTLLGTKLVIIGGQVDGSFYGDVFGFDLDKLSQSPYMWEDMAELPSPRTNHTTVNHNEMLYV